MSPNRFILSFIFQCPLTQLQNEVNIVFVTEEMNLTFLHFYCFCLHLVVQYFHFCMLSIRWFCIGLILFKYCLCIRRFNRRKLIWFSSLQMELHLQEHHIPVRSCWKWHKSSWWLQLLPKSKQSLKNSHKVLMPPIISFLHVKARFGRLWTIWGGNLFSTNWFWGSHRLNGFMFALTKFFDHRKWRMVIYKVQPNINADYET